MKNSFLKKINLNREVNIPILEVLFWILLMTCLPLFSGMISMESITLLFLYSICSFLLGDFTLITVESLKQLPTLLQVGVKMFFGMVCLGFTFLLVPSSISIILVFILIAIISWKSMKFLWDPFIWKAILTISPTFVFLAVPHEYFLSTSIFKGYSMDYSFYTTIVESLKVNQDFSNAIFQSGIGINYQAITFLVPAQIANFTGIPSQIALWGIFMNFLSVLSFSTLSWVILLLSNTVIDSAKQHNYLYVTIVCILLIFLGPIHIINIVNLNFKEVLFLGQGYLLPLGSPGFAYSIFWTGLLILMVFKNDKPSTKESILSIFFLVLIAGSKVAMWAPVIIFLGLYSVFRIMQKHSNFSIKWLYTCVIGGVASLILIYVLMLNTAAPTVMKLQLIGQNTIELVELSKKIGLNLSSITISVLFGFILRITFFIGPKLLLVYLVRLKYKIVKMNKPLILSLMLSFLFFSFIYLFLNSFALNLDGSLYRDMTFDNGQYLRTVFFLINIFVIINLIRVFRNKNLVFISGITIWLILCAFSFYYLQVKNQSVMSLNTSSWYSEVETDFHHIQPKKMIMLNDGNYSGLGLTAMGVAPWYIFGTKEFRDGYSNDFQSIKRRELINQFFNIENSLSYRQKIKNRLLRAGVDCVVATPKSLQKIKLAERNNLIDKEGSSKWIFKLKD